MDKPQTGFSTDDIVKVYQSMSQGQRGSGVMFIIIGLSYIYVALTSSEAVPLPLILPTALVCIVMGIATFVYSEAVVGGVLAFAVTLFAAPKLLASGITSWTIGHWIMLGFIFLLFFGFVNGISFERKYHQLPAEQQTVTRTERAHLVFPQFAIAFGGLALILFFAWLTTGQFVSEAVRAVVLESALRAGELGLSIGLASLYARFPHRALSIIAAVIGGAIYVFHYLLLPFFPMSQ